MQASTEYACMLPVAAAALCIRASDTALQERYDVSTLTLCLCLWCLPAHVQDLAAVAAPGSPLRTDVNAAVSDLSQAARSLRSFADQVEREPNSLIFGGSKP